MWQLFLLWWRGFSACDRSTGLSLEARSSIDSAISFFRQSKRKGDESWEAAFSALSKAEAMENTSFLDIRLYMCATTDGYGLFHEYYRETCNV